jgi:hypothetical protein
MTSTEAPRPGDIIYVNSSLFITHEDDFVGGMATVIEVEERPADGRKVVFVRVEEDPDTWYNWEHLEPQQEPLEKHFGKEWAFADPDPHPEFNHWD